MILIMSNTQNYLLVKEQIKNADWILIWAWAWLSTSAWLQYWDKWFSENFPELVENYWMTDFYTSSFYDFETEEERWSYRSKHIDFLYNKPALPLYKNIFELIKNKDYFVLSTNVDGQFLHAWFDKNKVFEIQWSLSKMQCSRACHNKLYDTLELVDKLKEYRKEIRIPTEFIPYCPNCWEKMELNLRKDRYFVEDNHWHKLNDNYSKFIEYYKDKKLLLIEFWVGYNTPWIIRYPFESMTYSFPDTRFIRVNADYSDIPKELEWKAIWFNDDCWKFVQ